MITLVLCTLVLWATLRFARTLLRYAVIIGAVITILAIVAT